MEYIGRGFAAPRSNTPPPRPPAVPSQPGGANTARGVVLGTLPNAFGKPCATHDVQASVGPPKSQRALVTRSHDGAACANVSGIATRRCTKLCVLTSTIADVTNFRSMRGTIAVAFAQNTCGARQPRLAAHADCHARGRVLFSKLRTLRLRNRLLRAPRPVVVIICASCRDAARSQKLQSE